ncbi:hypothetical protein [Romboutsia maritimum]|uniref:hypothetical protein n=1 Tax=Romboutsia maritimum TaxID=2020948 RepID=UPI001FB065BD|nr:hypothetical protein [Romboutsia maritimum]
MLKNELSDDFINHIKNLLIDAEDKDVIIKAFEEIKKQDYIDKYQRGQIIKGFNSVMLSKEFYNPQIFKNLDKETNKLIDKKSMDRV